MKIFKTNTVKKKLVLLFAFLVVAIALFVYLYFPVKFKHQRIQAISDKVHTVAKLTELSIGAGIYFKDTDVVKEEIKPLLKSKDIIFIVVKEKNGSMIYENNINKAIRYNYQKTNPSHISGDGSLFFEEIKIIFNEKDIGTLYLGYSLSSLHREVNEIKANVAQVSLLILIIGIICINFIGNLITNPLKKVVDTVEKISAGDFTQRVMISSNDEIGYLAKTFNQMVQNINSVTLQLENTNTGLEKRTIELEDVNCSLKQEIEQRKLAEEKIQHSLCENEVLLKEIHHRVKNNLQIISSLLYLNSKKIKDDESLIIFKESQNRIKSIALVHERLYQSHDFRKIDFNEYVKKLTTDLYHSFAINGSEIKLILDIYDIYISIEIAIPCGLIINELVSNSLKYAFPKTDQQNNNLEIKIYFIRTENNELLLEISDNGIGLPEGFDLKKSQSLGLQLVDTLITQLDGEREIDLTNGTLMRIKFRDDES